MGIDVFVVFSIFLCEIFYGFNGVIVVFSGDDVVGSWNCVWWGGFCCVFLWGNWIVFDVFFDFGWFYLSGEFDCGVCCGGFGIWFEFFCVVGVFVWLFGVLY